MLEQVRLTCRRRHLSVSTESAYINWIKRFIFFSGRRHPAALYDDHDRRFLSFLATKRRISDSTQNQVLNVIVFL